MPGSVEIVIRGRVATSVLPDFDAVVAATPGLSFGGPYDRARDLPALYGDVHFAWAIDFFEAGSNSDWLLPNRLYEAGLFGAVPIACRDVATGAWLAERGLGVLLGRRPRHRRSIRPANPRHGGLRRAPRGPDGGARIRLPLHPGRLPDAGCDDGAACPRGACLSQPGFTILDRSAS